MRVTNFESGRAAGSSEAVKLGVLLMHENLPAGLRGKRALDHVAENLDLKAEFSLRLWKFDLLHEPTLQRQAVDDARHANIVVLAAHDIAGLPPTVRAWLEEWAQGGFDIPRALVVSLDAGARDLPMPNPVLTYARAVAEASGVELFSHYGDTPRCAWDWSVQTPKRPAWEIQPRADLPEPHVAWGINE